MASASLLPEINFDRTKVVNLRDYWMFASDHRPVFVTINTKDSAPWKKDTVEKYLKRLEELESTANSFSGVEKTYAIQAGREIRVFVKPEEIDDLGALKLAREIADKIEQDLKYPGEIKVNVLRETRSVEYAR